MYTPMEDIEFRAWDEKNKIMHYDFQFIASGNGNDDWICFSSDKVPRKVIESKGIQFTFEFDNPYFRRQFKIMQYIRVKDNKGVKIYSGDIVSSGVINCICEYNNTTYDFKYKDKTGWGAPDIKQMWWTKGWGDMYRPIVIGNIYQNPELIDKENVCPT